MENLKPEEINNMSPEELQSLADSSQEDVLGEEFQVEEGEEKISIPYEEELPKDNIELLMDVELDVIIELGRTKMRIGDILRLVPGAIIELDKLAGEPVDVLVNNKPIAKGEVVVLDENFGVRITSIINQEQRLKSLG
ncbi:flagellar motor switch protein FliN [Candidatus Poribacteria bacterium]|nr:flagellar motor switch protein FliN [Candidatus Poribacteria bacterium]RLG54079.1 MAG: flagellar motor switch protein FliN [Candidatus Hydrothermarchaeota archaeon]HDO74994.1 flagellar motor switch protein FliN [Candidatus Poribacteria bacterium]HEX28599.1 flagellar motor switch protein FliN [Candidatus Poribacteria bacterium]